jgi:cysteine desulfurase/selenocysteine lyase
MDPGVVGMRLEKTFGILVRSGLHCSPNSHRTLGTFPEGTVRVSPGPFNTRREISGFLAALGKIAASRR